jgi:hypothetical protein
MLGCGIVGAGATLMALPLGPVGAGAAGFVANRVCQTLGGNGISFSGRP